ncbi:MAG TPA: selenocysteine-specific translation elongation factor [Bryobacteraceae bacterium]|jgi:selenocysteine-specific elongation factor|nr:selenocysteine-specific translation elongation factor [Bryobacteraceae bacterium]
MSRRGGIVVGTAGHIDHGKTSLVRALTGTDTDRLAEEKRRGISIDLGFAHLDLENGKTISFVDVPGHERFIRNMLAGAAGIEAVLLVVAADECVKPQTREHFDICRLLGIERGIIALTKSDLVLEAQLLAAEAAVRELVARSFLETAPVVPVSAHSGPGLKELRMALAQLAENKKERQADGFARLPVDRSFALKGFGTVVTGTLIGGALRAGDNVHIYPTGKSARIRGLQVHGAAVERAFPGERTAVNLSGIDHAELRRGFVLCATDRFTPTTRVQVSLTLLHESKLDAREELLFHSGTFESPGRLRMLAPGYAELQLNEPVLALAGDRFVLRRPSPSATIGGGSILDIFPPGRISRAKMAVRISQLAAGTLKERLAVLVEEKSQGRTLDELVRLTGETPQQIRNTIANASALLYAEAAQRVLSKGWLEAARKRVLAELGEFHASHPAENGAPLSLVRFGMENALANFVLTGMTGIRLQGDTIALATHRAQLSDRETAELTRIEQQFRAAAYQPPPPGTFPRSPIERLIKSGKLVRVSNDLVFHADVIAHLRSSLANHKGRRFSVPEFKDWTQISRKYAIPLLEFLDHQHVTRREGDLRVVL